MTEESNGELLRFIATTVEALRDESLGGGMATKDDLAELRIATKDDLAELRMATKDDLAELRMAMKDELIGLSEEITAVRSEAKADVARLEARMDTGFTTVRGDIERVNFRLDSIDRALSTRLSQVETEVSRIRSVVYLLAKNQPELLRLLGSNPPLV